MIGGTVQGRNALHPCRERFGRLENRLGNLRFTVLLGLLENSRAFESDYSQCVSHIVKRSDLWIGKGSEGAPNMCCNNSGCSACTLPIRKTISHTYDRACSIHTWAIFQANGIPVCHFSHHPTTCQSQSQAFVFVFRKPKLPATPTPLVLCQLHPHHPKHTGQPKNKAAKTSFG